jgi:hypothetical protein
MKLPGYVKVLGIFVVTFEGACALFLICLPPVLGTLAAAEAKTVMDWLFVAVMAICVPCHPGIRDVAHAFTHDLQQLRELW